ncbi:MAG: glycine--tRNA ligase [Flavobacteriales bacterium]|nr:glycine--tRNA ligase [Flavobacteriales bacterium]
MANSEDIFKKIISHAKEYGFVFPSSEIYDGLSAVYDYGQNGVELKNNIKNYWWASMVRMNENIVGLDAAILMHPKTWKASGHVDAFSDPLIDNKDSKKRYRADNLIEEYMGKISAKINKEVVKAARRFGDAFNEETYRTTNERVMGYQSKIDAINTNMVKAIAESDMDGLRQIIIDAEIACPISGSKNWTEVRQFNLMFSTEMGSVSSDSSTIYLRPETAQGIFVNFLNVQKTSRLKVPFGIAQIGKAFRNEIVARQFIFRLKEFEQMEMQYFVKPGEQMKWFEEWKEKRLAWYIGLGLPKEKLRFHAHENLAHYADAAEDIEFDFPMGFREIEGIHSRTDFDLGAHESVSGKKLQYFDSEANENYTPYVVETSMGLDRMVLAVLSHSYTEETLEDGSSRVVMKIPPQLAPIKAAFFPLVKKDGLPEIAREIIDNLKLDFNCLYEEKDTIGKRYRRQDAVGTPFCVTIDHDTLNDQQVTIRERDSMEQKRVPIKELGAIIGKAVDIKSLFV